METFAGLIEILKTPVLWTAITLCACCGVLGLANPRLLEKVNKLSTTWVDTNWMFSFMDKTVHVDKTLAKHGRIFGLCAVVAAVGLFYQFS